MYQNCENVQVTVGAEDKHPRLEAKRRSSYAFWTLYAFISTTDSFSFYFISISANLSEHAATPTQPVLPCLACRLPKIAATNFRADGFRAATAMTNTCATKWWTAAYSTV